jgi:hypothetical protein
MTIDARRRALRGATLVAAMISAGMTLVGQATVDVTRLGPQVGDIVPAFSLVDQDGRTRNLQSAMGAKGAMLVFFRSADW